MFILFLLICFRCWYIDIIIKFIFSDDLFIVLDMSVFFSIYVSSLMFVWWSSFSLESSSVGGAFSSWD